MDQLHLNWLTNGLIDFEYKKYILLAYLKTVKERFDEGKLYPQLADIILHYRNLIEYRQKKDQLNMKFPKSMNIIDIEKLKFTYIQIIEDDELMKELEQIVFYAIPKIEKTLKEGKELYDWVEEQIKLETVGLIPIYKREGYLMIASENESHVDIFSYEMSLIKSKEDQFKAIHTTYLGREFQSIINTFHQMKLNLINKFRHLPNPATFLLISKLSFPLNETLLPISKRILMKHVQLD